MGQSQKVKKLKKDRRKNKLRKSRYYTSQLLHGFISRIDVEQDGRFGVSIKT